MMKIYQTQDKRLTRTAEIDEGAWVCLTAPTADEIRQVAATLDIEPADLQAALDPEESARVSLEDGYTVIIVDIPIQVPDKGVGVYTTIPLGILLTQQTLTTVCSVDTQVLQDFAACRVREFSTRKKMRFVYQILNRAAMLYQQELRLIDRRRQEIEKNLSGVSMRDSDLIELHLEEPLTLTGLAAQTGYTESYLSRRFKQEVGVNVNEYIRFARVERAKMMLGTTDLPVAEIAERLQFCSSSHFAQAFRQVTGQTPRQWRGKNGAKTG